MTETHIRRDIGAKALTKAERQLQLHYLIGGLDPVLPTSMYAALLNGRRTEDDADPFVALVTVMELLLGDQAPTMALRYDPDTDLDVMQPMTQVQKLRKAVEALERVSGRQFQREPAFDDALVNLNEAGERSAVRPEDVPPALREHTVRFWQAQHARMSEQHSLLQVTDEYDEKAKLLVAEARIAGAFILPFDEMPGRQKDFWRQRAAGFEHKFI